MNSLTYKTVRKRVYAKKIHAMMERLAGRRFERLCQRFANTSQTARSRQTGTRLSLRNALLFAPVNWNREMKRRGATGNTFGPDPPAVGLDDALCDVKA
jgi:hypothetical protein